jgi:cytidine deaminase
LRIIIEGLALDAATEALLQQVARAAQELEGFAPAAYASLLMTDDDGIQAINAQTRHIDQPTDVLSFPILSFSSGQTVKEAEALLQREWDPQEAACFLGDIVISLPQAQHQALTYEHSLKREICYLLAHGLFHLFGYDHLKEEDKTKMRAKEEATLAKAGQSLVDDESLLDQARQAMQEAYAPYSHYRVGACLLAQDGRIFTGCNVENASYGLTNCGERTAIFKAVSEGAIAFTTLAIAAQSYPPWPCGACRQVLSEFCADLRILISWGDGEVEETTLKALLPHSFSPVNGVQDVLGKEQND